MDRERIEAQLAQYEQERATFLEQAPRQIAMLDGAIAALRQLLAADAAAAVEADAEQAEQAE